MICTCYHPRSEASEGYVFTGVCHYVTKRGGGVDVQTWSRGGGVDVLTWSSPPLGQGHLPPLWDQDIYPPSGTRTSTPLGTRTSTPPWDQDIYPPPPSGTRTSTPPPRDQDIYPPPGTRTYTPPPSGTRTSTPPPSSRLHAGGRYACYWNAFLFFYCIT